MENNKTPKPGTKGYSTDKPEDLTTPRYNSSTDRRNSDELPATENLNDHPQNEKDENRTNQDLPKTDLGNDPSDDEKQRERIITP